MPTPGGGSRGGGFGGGANRGGSYNSGYGGGGRRMGGGFFFFPWRRPYYGYGGGFFGGLFGLFFLPIIILIMAGALLVSSIVMLVSAIADGGVVQYSETKFENYANEQYQAIYGAPEYAGTYEDNLLLVITTNEDFNDYYALALVGTNISTKINLMFGDERTEFGAALERCINQKSYQSTLSQNLAMAVDLLNDEVSIYKNPFVTDTSAQKHAPPTVINNDEDLVFDEQTLLLHLNKFTEETGIPISVVVDDEADVFGKSVPVSYIIFGTLSLAIIIFAGVWIYKSIKAKRRANRESENRRSGTDYNDPRYWN